MGMSNYETIVLLYVIVDPSVLNQVLAASSKSISELVHEVVRNSSLRYRSILSNS
jgi:hypothetical protein